MKVQRTSLSVDATVGAAYLQLSDEAVTETIEITPAVQVDVDATGALVGVEILDFSAEIPSFEIATRFHLPPDQHAALHQTQTSLAAFATGTSSATGLSSAVLVGAV